MVQVLLKIVTSKKVLEAMNQYLQRVWICLSLLLLWEVAELVLAKERGCMAFL